MEYWVDMQDLFDEVNMPLTFKIKSDVDFNSNKGRPIIGFVDYEFNCTVVEKNDYSQQVNSNNLFSDQYIAVWIRKEDVSTAGLSQQDFSDAKLTYEGEVFRSTGKRSRNNLSAHYEFIFHREGGK